MVDPARTVVAIIVGVLLGCIVGLFGGPLWAAVGFGMVIATVLDTEDTSG